MPHEHDVDASPIAKQLQYHYIIKNAKVCVNPSSFHNIQYLKLNEKSLYEVAVRAGPLVFEEASYAIQLISSSL